MAGLELNASPGFLLLAAALYFLGGTEAVTAFLAAALAHELGHLTALFVTGASLRGVRVTACGPVLEYAGCPGRRQELAIVAAGPLTGMLFATLCFITDIPFLIYTGAIALLSACFNLLPVPSMDGGRLAALLLESVMPPAAAAAVLRVTGTLCALGVIVTGIWIQSPAAAAAGIWMGLLANVPKLR